MASETFLPELKVQRQILEGKRDQLRAQAFEQDLTATLNDVQAPLETDPAQKKQLLETAKRQRINSRQLYAAARECQRQIDALPEPEEETPAEEEPETE